MSSPRQFIASSPISPNGSRRRKSAFTYKHLNQLSHYSTTCPLRVIAHIDLDAFYAQCEMVRLGVPSDQPLAVQQWQGLIAINYAARAFNLNRHVTIVEAKKACPHIILQHVATWREGDEKWAYHKDAFAQIATHKVSLDPYRLESRRILAVIKDYLPAKLQRVEKAGIDEVFVDLSAQVQVIMLQRYPMLRGPAPYDDPSEHLPQPPTTAIDWDTDALVDLDRLETEHDDPDWDDIAMSIASEIVRGIRAQILKTLKYTCSAGIAKNKMLAKLGSGHKKPNQQTIVRNRAVQQFLSGFRYTKIRNLGGKLGDEVVAAFNTDLVSELLGISLEQFRSKFSDDTGSWLYNVIRGEDQSEVNPRTQIKSMLSAKSFRPSINSLEVASKWLRIFVADIFSRLVEEGVLDNKRRPKTINLHHRQGAQTRSKQAPIPSGRAIDEGLLFDLAKTLLGQVVVDGRAWPCANLSLSVGGFEDGVKDNKGISNFLVRGDEAKAMVTSSRGGESDAPPGKRRKIEEGIRTFFGTRRDESSDAPENDAQPEAEDDPFLPPPSAQEQGLPDRSSAGMEQPVMPPDRPDQQALFSARPNMARPTFVCERCGRSMDPDEQAEHQDWHFARDLQRQETQSAATTATTTMTAARPLSAAKNKSVMAPKRSNHGRATASAAAGPGNSDTGLQKGQRKLAFG